MLDIQLRGRALVTAAIALLMGTLALGYALLPRYRHGNEDFFYPIVFFYGTPFVLVLVLGLGGFIIWLHRKRLIQRTNPFVLVFMVSITCAITFCVALDLWFSPDKPLPAHYDSIVFNNRVFYLARYLAISMTSEADPSRFLIYGCDSCGIRCSLIQEFIGYRYRTQAGREVAEHDVYFFTQEDNLYVQIGSQSVVVPINR
jgi:hypothetical protein